jgi:hypothetical protein
MRADIQCAARSCRNVHLLASFDALAAPRRGPRYGKSVAGCCLLPGRGRSARGRLTRFALFADRARAESGAENSQMAPQHLTQIDLTVSSLAAPSVSSARGPLRRRFSAALSAPVACSAAIIGCLSCGAESAVGYQPRATPSELYRSIIFRPVGAEGESLSPFLTSY